ncbi:alpha/beta hydrolase [Hyphomicrobium sp.]|uniref:alpha/beta fold hydrolase n=1 Tax=Hyphomicrobium sp. TaxID=82 RepID=UPI002D78BE04|nr:alpha/beta hydrolase [Hyphomicrobium sp.]HET6389787.1 alpha/beta hydrolase [Hyphomicrobium sp.]
MRDRKSLLTSRILWGGIAGLLASAVAVRYLTHRAEARFMPVGRKVHVEGHELQVFECGEGPPVLVLHGNGGMLQDLLSSQLLMRLAERHHVIALDRPGFGATPRDAETTWTPELEADQIAKLLDTLGIERAVVVAHSWATLVALALALQHREKVSGLVLLSGFYFPEFRLDALLAAPAATPVLGRIVTNTVWPLIARLSAPLIFRRIFAPRPVSKRFLRAYPIELAARPSQLKAVADDTWMMQRAAARLQPHYTDVDVPVRLIAGEDDRIVATDKHSQRLHELLPNSEIYVVPDTGHMVHHAEPEIIARAAAELQDLDSEENATGYLRA